MKNNKIKKLALMVAISAIVVVAVFFLSKSLQPKLIYFKYYRNGIAVTQIEMYKEDGVYYLISAYNSAERLKWSQDKVDNLSKLVFEFHSSSIKVTELPKVQWPEWLQSGDTCCDLPFSGLSYQFEGQPLVEIDLNKNSYDEEKLSSILKYISQVHD